MERPEVFIVSANEAIRDSTRQLVESAGLQAETFASMQVFIDTVAQGRQGCLLLDACQDDLIDPLMQTRLAAAFERMPGLLLTDHGDVPMAVLALKAGAMDVVQKPFSNDNLLGRIKHALLCARA